MGRFSLSHASPEHEEDEQLSLARVDDDNCIQAANSSPHHLNPIFIYYTHEPPPQIEQPLKQRISYWWWIAAVVVIAHVVQRYGPPAPPPASTIQSWQDFFREEGERLLQSLKTFASVIPHVWYWCIQGIRHEVEILYEEWTSMKTLSSVCPMLLSDNTDFEWQIVGQSRAVSIVENALTTWDQASPLFLLLAGSVGVGKRELALQVSSNLFGDCSDAVLELDGQDNNAEDLFATKISQLVRRQNGNGAVVIIRHLEELSSSELLSLIEVVRQHERIVLIATTGIGTQTINNHLKETKGEMDGIPLESSIRDEMNEYYDENVAVSDISLQTPILRPELPLTLFLS